jgi:3-hydroxyisobutyrate dehydrogenase-like beta-hydroxyacid dehydrogenase
MKADAPTGIIGLGLMGTALAARLPMTSAQAALLRAAIALRGPDSDSAAVIEAIRRCRTGPGEFR